MLYIDDILLEKIIFQEMLFQEHIKLSSKINNGDWLFFEIDNKLYLLKSVNNISDINILEYQHIPKIYNLLFFVNSSKKIYSIIEGYIKKVSFINYHEQNIDDSVYMCLELPVSTLNAIKDKIRLFYMLKEYDPLQVKIMHLKDKVYILYAENKCADKNGYYSLDKRLVKDGVNLFHFVVKEKNKNCEKENILRTEIKFTKLNIKNNRYIVNQNEYKKIESN